VTQSALPPDVRSALLRYRILANIVGVLLIPLVVFAWPRHLLYDESSGIYQAGEWVNTHLGPLHGVERDVPQRVRDREEAKAASAALGGVTA